MQSFLWAIGSLVILIPIIYFLPLGISARGKWIIVILSFLLGVIGLIAQMMFPLWEFSILIILLVGLLAFVLDKRMGSLLYTALSLQGEEEWKRGQEVDPFLVEREPNHPFLYEEENIIEMEQSLEDQRFHSMETTSNDESALPFSDSDSSEVMVKNVPDIIGILEEWDEQISLLPNSGEKQPTDKEDDETLLQAIEGNYLVEIEELVNQANTETGDYYVPDDVALPSHTDSGTLKDELRMIDSHTIEEIVSANEKLEDVKDDIGTIKK